LNDSCEIEGGQRLKSIGLCESTDLGEGPSRAHLFDVKMCQANLQELNSRGAVTAAALDVAPLACRQASVKDASANFDARR
jgi:hypothetical protein